MMARMFSIILQNLVEIERREWMKCDFHFFVSFVNHGEPLV